MADHPVKKPGKPINIGMIGCGTVGGGVAHLLSDHAARYQHLIGRPITLRRVLVRDTAKPRDLPALDPACLTTDADTLFNDDSIDLIVEVAGGIDSAAAYVRRAIQSGKHVVTANKSLLAAQGPELFELARAHNVSIAFEASCGGGIPLVTSLCFGLMANDIRAMYGILNGTCNYILTQMARHATPYADVLDDAKKRGYAEADPTLDVSGRDAAEKLAILASLAFGKRIHGDQVWAEGIEALDSADLRCADELGYEMKLLAIAEKNDNAASAASADSADRADNADNADNAENAGNASISLRVHPALVHRDEALAHVSDTFNALSIYGDAVGHTMLFGRGAGRLPTASAVVSDILNIAAGWYPDAFAKMNLWSNGLADANIAPASDLITRFYLRFNAKDVPGVLAKMTKILGDQGISISGFLQHEFNEGQFVPVVLVTHHARQGAIDAALNQIAALDLIQGEPVRIRIVDMPREQAD